MDEPPVAALDSPVVAAGGPAEFEMPNPSTILLKAIFCFAVAVVLFQFAQQVATVEVTVFAQGTMTKRAVADDDPVYGSELDLARKRAMWVYVLSGSCALIGILMVRKSVRVRRKQRTA
jgi:hypothetical protein